MTQFRGGELPMALQPSQKVDAIVDEMVSIFRGVFGHDPDFNNPRQCALAISRWLQVNRPGEFVGGFFDGEESRNGQNQRVFGVICVGKNP